MAIGTPLTRSLRAGILICVVLAVPGCGGNPAGEGRLSLRRAAADPITITFTEAPAEWATLERGATMLAGTILASNGLDPANPKTLVLQVKDLATGITKERGLDDLTAFAAQPPLDFTTGQFLLNLSDDFRLGVEGQFELSLHVQDSLANGASWTRHVQTTPLFSNWSWGQLAQARQQYGVQLHRLFSTYQEFIAQVIAAGTDEETFPYQDYDTRIMELTETVIRANFIEHPHTNGWRARSVSYASEVSGLSSFGAPLPAAETRFREHVEDDAALISLRFSLPATTRRDWQLLPLEGTSPADLAPDFRRWDEAFFRNVFSTATITTEDEGATLIFQGALFANDGLFTSEDCCDNYPPFTEPEADSWQENDPVFWLTVTVRDTDEDGLFDTLVQEGLCNGASLLDNTLSPEEQVTYADDLQDERLPHQGHLIGPLTHLVSSQYFRTS